MKHLRYDCISAYYDGENRHPQEVLRSLGITYEVAIPQSICDQWWLFNCQYSHLPKFITEMKLDEEMVNRYKMPKSYINNK